MKSIKIAGKKMDRNLKILKQTIADGIKKDCLQDKLLLLSNDFEKSVIHKEKIQEFQEYEDPKGSSFSNRIIFPK